MDTIMPHPEGCCHAQLLQEIEAIRELRAELDGFVRAVMQAKRIVDGSRPQPVPARRTAQVMQFSAARAVS